MNDFISRESAKKLICRRCGSPNGCKDQEFCPFICDLNDIPAADLRPVVRGEWYGSGDGYADGHLVIDDWSCPFCGKYFPEWDEKPDWNFCPNCGADMRGEK